MEPIRPDEDELRAERETHNPQPKAKEKGKPARKASTGNARKPVSSGFALFLGLVLVAGVAGFGWFKQEQRIKYLESQLEEADYWTRQSKLALARFEGELSETGENLQEKGQSIEQQLTAQGKRLDNADSEIRKLWGVANDRNKKRLNEHETQLASLKSMQSAGEDARNELKAAINGVEKEFSSRLGNVRAALAQDISAQGQTLENLESSLADVGGQVESRLTRFEREQKLRIDGLEGRINTLEKTAQSLSGDTITSIESELASLKQTVSSIDASRAQLTSRLVRLSEEIDQLRSGAGGSSQ